MTEIVANGGIVQDQRLIALKAQSEDIGEARKALESATSIARGLWFTFLSLAAYLVIAVGSVTHRDLFLETPVRLPLLNVDLPLVTFFWVAPMMFLVIHAYLLLNLKFMGDNARHYFNEVDRTGLSNPAKDALFLQLPNFVIMQMLIVRRQPKWGIMGFAMHFVVIMTVIVGPILILLFLQLQFLPYHSVPVTKVQRLALIGDMILIVFFWSRIVGDPATRRIAVYRYLVWSLVFLIILFSVFVARFPAERSEQLGVALTDYLLHGTVDEVKGRRESLFSDTLVLPDADFVSADDAKLPTEISVALRGRDLSGAMLARTDLRKADFTGANLQGADLKGADLRGAEFHRPNSPIVVVNRGSNAKSASLPRYTNMVGVNLVDARLDGADMRGASLQRAQFDRVQLNGANLDNAELQGATLKNCQLVGVSLRHANFTGTLIANSDMQNARMSNSVLAGTLLTDTNLQGVNLDAADMRSPTLLNVNVFGVSDINVDWTTAVAKGLTSVRSEFKVDLEDDPLAVVGFSTGNSDDEFAVATLGNGTPLLDPAAKAEMILTKAIGKFAIPNDPTLAAIWEKRVDLQKKLMCEDADFGIDVYKRLLYLRVSKEDQIIQFGPKRQEVAAFLLGPQCKNSAILRQASGGLLETWANVAVSPAAK